MTYRSLSKIAVTLAVLTALVTVAESPMRAQSYGYSAAIDNRSGYTIYRLYMSPSGSNHWGRDLLGGSVLRSGWTFTLRDMAPGNYDMAMVDQDGDVCRVWRVPVFANQSWTISQPWLLNCEPIN